jgi:hypothetical protein
VEILDLEEKEIPVRNHPVPWIYVLLAIILIGFLVPMSEYIFTPRYPSLSGLTSPGSNEENKYLRAIEQFGLDATGLQAFIQDNPRGRVLIGNALYPRYYRANEGLEARYGPYYEPYDVFDFARVAFKIIGPMGTEDVILPLKSISFFPHASDIIVIACRVRAYNIAIAVILIGDESVMYEGAPSAKLACQQ